MTNERFNRHGRATGRAALTRLLAGLMVASGLLLVGSSTLASGASLGTCGRNYVSAGDDVPAGNKVSDTERYPAQLISTHGATYGFCNFDLAANGTTSSTENSGGQLATTWNRQADLITLQVGEQNSSIVDLITSCFDKVKDHDFIGASTCAASVLGNQSAFNSLKSDLTFTLQQYRQIMAGRPQLVVAVLGYGNPYPDALSATEKMVELCVPLIDTIPTCIARWAQLPPALLLLDIAIKALNANIQAAVKPFQTGPSANRFVFVDTYTKTRDHCMKMEVTIKTQVEHPEEDGVVHEHDSPAVNFGCSSPWYVAGDDGTKSPDYLDPAAIGVLIQKSQTTTGMGVYPNADGHKCIADLIWEADTIDPGTTPLKWKLGVPEAPKTDICQ